jgi:hypothetical protein
MFSTVQAFIDAGLDMRILRNIGFFVTKLIYKLYKYHFNSALNK